MNYYILEVDYLSKDLDISAYEIENWMLMDELPKEAKEFMRLADISGKVIKGTESFIHALNLEDVELGNAYVFATNKQL